MRVEQILSDEIKESKRWIDKAEGVNKRDLVKRIELINWVLDNMKNSNVPICELMESKMNETVLKINKTYTIEEADILHSELRILDWIFYQVCNDQQKRLSTNQGYQ
ncbi:MAG TPA: hypothetical protein VJ599_07250 [Nitrososphaeraceae archaeon]|nr:hypothetical protein [Nitrososphaeraceae archaeon]